MYLQHNVLVLEVSLGRPDQSSCKEKELHQTQQVKIRRKLNFEMGSDKFCLKWNDFETNISTAFRELREDSDFFDCTLMSCDDEQINAHKVILSACSPLFRNILRKNPSREPVLWMKDVKIRDLQAVPTFM